MRLFLLPISTRRTLIYCQRLNVATTTQPGVAGWPDRISQKAATTWADWEKKEKGWQKKLTEYGNKALEKIPYEEWGLKSVPPISQKQKELQAKKDIDLVFPKSVIEQSQVTSIVKQLATERLGLHKSRLIYSIIGMPITIPCMLVPVIPNIPFFYLVYRAWSHWRAWSGSKHLQFLLEKNLIRPTDSTILNQIYGNPTQAKAVWTEKAKLDSKEPDETMLLTNSASTEIAKSLNIPELGVELERAVWQVSNSLGEEKQKAEETKRGIVNRKRQN